ncbi:MAG: DUF6634 family protein [Pseudomonadota bacterium]
MPKTIDHWSIDADPSDEPVLVGDVDGATVRTAPVVRLDLATGQTVTINAETWHLGEPQEPLDFANPLCMPADVEARLMKRARDALARLRRGDLPTEAELAGAPTLTAWFVVERNGYASLAGVVTGHPRLFDDAFVRTSPLLWIAEDRSAARTASRFYRLDEPRQDLARR